MIRRALHRHPTTTSPWDSRADSACSSWSRCGSGSRTTACGRSWSSIWSTSWNGGTLTPRISTDLHGLVWLTPLARRIPGRSIHRDATLDGDRQLGHCRRTLLDRLRDPPSFYMGLVLIDDRHRVLQAQCLDHGWAAVSPRGSAARCRLHDLLHGHQSRWIPSTLF